MNLKEIKEISKFLEGVFRRLAEEPGLNLAGSIENNLVDIVQPLNGEIAGLRNQLAKANKETARLTRRLSHQADLLTEARQKLPADGPVDPPLWALKLVQRMGCKTVGELVTVARTLVRQTEKEGTG